MSTQRSMVSENLWGENDRSRPLYWVGAIFVAIVVIYIIFLSFPPPFLKVVGPAGHCVVDYAKLFFVSVLVALIFVLIFWVASKSCY